MAFRGQAGPGVPAGAARRMRAQAALEQMLIVGFALLFISIVFYFAFAYADDSIKVAQAKDSVEKVARSADAVHALGPGTKSTVTLNLPRALKFVTVAGNAVQMRISLSSGDTDVFAKSTAQLSGSIQANSGMQEVVLIAGDDGKVYIGGKNSLACAPSSLSKTFAQGGSGTDLVNVTNVGTANVTGITANISGITDIAGIAQPNSSLVPGASTRVNISFSVPGGKSVGTYTGTLSVNGSNGSACTSSITVFVTPSGGPDTTGPAVNGITVIPSSPTILNGTRVNATATDAVSAVSGCKLELDYSGIWNSMSASDGFYSSLSENVTYYLGLLGAGNHTARIYCTDIVGNAGAINSAAFNVSDVTAGNSSNNTTDTRGPVVTNVNITPSSPNSTSLITVNATANDSATGGSNISMCQLAVDGFNWENMNATDGAYGTLPTENVTDVVGPYSGGNHSLGVRCNDTAGNWGNIATYNFSVTQLPVPKDIAFVVLNPNDWYIDSEEWYGFITSHTSGMGFNWSIDVVNSSSISTGALNLSNYYRIAILCNSNTTNDTAFYPKLLQYEKEGHYVVLLGLGAKDGTRWLNGATATGTAAAAATLVPRTAHYITTNFTIGTTYTVQTASNTQYYNTATSLTPLLSTTTTGRLVVGNKSNANDRLLVFAVTRPSTFTAANGTVMATRAIDWALNNSVPGTG